jgi:protein-S-isoprenylcysteine O-methyltransferase Ste14
MMVLADDCDSGVRDLHASDFRRLPLAWTGPLCDAIANRVAEHLGSTLTRYHANEPMYVIDYVIYGLWIVFWVAWLVAGLTAKRAAQSRMGQFLGLRIAVFVVVYLIIRFGVLKGHHAIVSSPTLQTIGMVLFLIGLALTVWARIHLGRNWGTPMSEKMDAELITTGPYRFIRNPIYSGILLAAIGTSVAISWYWLVAFVLMGAYFVYSANVEEQTMQRLFPNTYPEYRRSTKKLIPFVF